MFVRRRNGTLCASDHRTVFFLVVLLIFFVFAGCGVFGPVSTADEESVQRIRVGLPIWILFFFFVFEKLLDFCFVV